MPFQMCIADGESHGKGRNNCNRYIIRAKKLFMRIAPRMEDAIKRLFTFWQVIAFCLTFSNLRDEKQFGIYYQKLVANRITLVLWVLWSNARCLHCSWQRQTKKGILMDNMVKVQNCATHWKSTTQENEVSQSIPIKVMNAVVLRPFLWS